MESKEEQEVEREVTTEEFADDTEVLFPMENLSLVSSQDQDETFYRIACKNADQHEEDCPRGGGGGTFCRLQVYKRVEKSVIRVLERTFNQNISHRRALWLY